MIDTLGLLHAQSISSTGPRRIVGPLRRSMLDNVAERAVEPHYLPAEYIYGNQLWYQIQK